MAMSSNLPVAGSYKPPKGPVSQDSGGKGVANHLNEGGSENGGSKVFDMKQFLLKIIIN